MEKADKVFQHGLDYRITFSESIFKQSDTKCLQAFIFYHPEVRKD